MDGLETIAAIVLPVFLFMLSIWWRVEARQDRKLDELRKANDRAHEFLRDKIDATNDQTRSEYRHIRDKIEEIWKKVVRHD